MGSLQKQMNLLLTVRFSMIYPYLVYSKLKEHDNKLNDHTNQIQILKTMNGGSNKSGDGG
jgi:hypothetical protein